MKPAEPLWRQVSPYSPMALRWRPSTRSEWRLATGLAILIWCACTPLPPPRLPPPRSYNGHWKGTSQGRAIAFTVSGNRITALTFDYACSGGSGSMTIPADVPLMSTFNDRTAAAVRFSPGGPSGSSQILVRFLFQTVKGADVIVEFTNDPACGTSQARWHATR